ncbi:MAG: beta-N-acetylhexosaminidase [Bdellovibrionales bacterium]|jgi:beta-N-acetylhexosaminidase|nr:beta-N-acetylhexosaminidase [Bdellovibrionales bacterium]MBT3525697.1 beta-N-acetylhexosaminidase [Bdellovibrionales bacterium]MBT7670005.1 beta-N-acetylhexosaminidase [Bdellovibrionales bacterium]MBT7766636.1 beta-N-acetylhexosaminidase [Bdellovibrionales bacterium]
MINQLGQLFMTGISGYSLTPEESSFLEKENIGGVILFTHNYESTAQLAELVNQIQTLRDDYPLLVAVDHEGGRVIRFKHGFTQFPAMGDIASLESPKMVFRIHQIMAQELSACGVNLSFAPCCDILTNPNNKVIGDRSFGSDGGMVSKFISSAIRGLQTSNVMACAKHFPGHGSTTKDSHFDLPVIKLSEEEILNQELVPFIKAVKSKVDFVMMGHLMVDAIDQKLPASLSPAAHELLRSNLKFKKVIISDDLQMKAITDNYGQDEAASLALMAGTDILLYRDISETQQAYEGVRRALKTKKIKNDLIQEKLKRIVSRKREYLSDFRPVYIPQISKLVNSKQTQILLDEINKNIADKKASI